MQRGTFGHVPARLPNQPLPFTADMRFLDWKAAVFEMRKPMSLRHL
jgi:hypothetical protein